MLKWALIFAVISVIAAIFGFTGISAATAGVAKILFFIALTIFVIFLLLGIFAAKRSFDASIGAGGIGKDAASHRVPVVRVHTTRCEYDGRERSFTAVRD